MQNVIIHSFYNHFLISPVILTILQLVILPALLILVYNRSEHSLRDWMELSLESDINIIQDINNGQFSETKLGRYLYSLKGKFQDYVVDIGEKFDELVHLEKNIGKTGRLALSPILKINTRNLWQLYFLKTKR